VALQSSGAISISQIKAELGNSSNSLRTLSAAAGKSTPDSMSEFYGYSAFAVPTFKTVATGSTVTGGGTAGNPYVITQVFNNSFANDIAIFECDVDYSEYFLYCWNFNPWQSEFVRVPLTFTTQEAGGQSISIKITGGSISNFTSGINKNFMRVYSNLHYAGDQTNFYSNPTQSALQAAINQTTTTSNPNVSSNIDFEIIIYASRDWFSECIGYNNGFGYPQINSLTYEVWFNKL
jgi:hypothetical protein